MTACHCDYDPAEFYHKELRKARKPHRCDECGRAIMSGERYEHVRAKWDGYVSTLRTCPRCLTLRAWVLAHVPCFCWSHQNMREDARETIDEYKHECPGLWFGWGRLEIAVRAAPRP